MYHFVFHSGIYETSSNVEINATEKLNAQNNQEVLSKFKKKILVTSLDFGKLVQEEFFNIPLRS